MIFPTKHKMILWTTTFLLLGGCHAPEATKPEKPTKAEEAREKAVFWDYAKPKVALDPIEEEDAPFIENLPEEDLPDVKK